MKYKFNIIKKAAPFLLASLISFNVAAKRKDCEFIDENNDGKPEKKKCVVKKGNSLEHTLEHLDSLGNTEKKETYFNGIYTLIEYKRDNQGNIIEENKKIDNDTDKDFDLITKTKYNNEGNKISVTKYLGENSKPEEIIGFDKKGNISKKCHITRKGMLCDILKNGKIVAQEIDKNNNQNFEARIDYYENMNKKNVYLDFDDDGNTDEIIEFNKKGNKIRETTYWCENDTLISKIDTYRTNGKKDSSIWNRFADKNIEKITLYGIEGKKQKTLINSDSDNTFEEKLYFENNRLVKQELDSNIWEYEYNKHGEIRKINKRDKKTNYSDFYLTFSFIGGRMYDIKMKKQDETLKKWYLTSKSTKDGCNEEFRDILKEVGNTGIGYMEAIKNNKN